MKKRLGLFLTTLLLLPALALAMGPCREPLYPGIDVSVWQRSIDWAQVRASGIQVAYIRASEGSRVEDSMFRQNYEGAKANGIKVGFYHYMTARSVTEAENQAEFFARVIRGTRPDCRLALDYEATGGLTAQEITACALAFLQRLEEVTGWETCLYSDAWAARERFGPELAQYPLWIADWGAREPENNDKWTCWAGWQYTDDGRVRGIAGRVDLDYFNEAVFMSARPTPVPTHQPTPEPTEIPTPAPACPPTPCPTIPLPECLWWDWDQRFLTGKAR